MPRRMPTCPCPTPWAQLGAAQSRGAPHPHAPGPTVRMLMEAAQAVSSISCTRNPQYQLLNLSPPHLPNAGGGCASCVVARLHPRCFSVQREAVGGGVAAAAGLDGGHRGDGERRGELAARLAAAQEGRRAEGGRGPGTGASASSTCPHCVPHCCHYRVEGHVPCRHDRAVVCRTRELPGSRAHGMPTLASAPRQPTPPRVGGRAVRRTDACPTHGAGNAHARTKLQ